jgi:purine-nucleoside/S-methyl-5'-thioadenosine phosphorylase / adenosine deaminase
MIKVDANAIAPETRARRSAPASNDNRGCPAAGGVAMTLPAPGPGFRWTRESWGDALRCDPLAAHAQHVFTSRQLALPSAESWRAALAAVNSTPARLMRVKQVHGSVVRVLRRGEVATEASADRPDGDGIVSNEPGLALAVLVADCNPILIADPKRGAAAAVHAGWRGTCARIAPTAIDVMRREFGSDPRDLIAAIGPSVGPDDYEVGEELIGAFASAGHPDEDIDRWFVRTPAKPRLDLWTANRDQLAASGLARDSIYLCGLSTVSHPDILESYRVAGAAAGRMAGIIVVPT